MFVRAANPIWSFVDLTGLELNDQYYAFFLGNVFPYATQPVYSTPNGTVWNNPLQLYANGTLPNNLYFNPTLVYRIEIRRGPTQNDALVYVIENFVPGSGSSSGSSSSVTANQIQDSQFSIVDFGPAIGTTIPTLNITSAGSYDVAPGWSLVLTGSGTAKVTQVINNAYSTNQINNPTYSLDILTSMWTTAQLIQTLPGNPLLWASTTLPSGQMQDGFVSMSVTAMAIGSPYSLSIAFSNGFTPATTPTGFSAQIGVDQFQVLSGTVLVPQPTGGTSTGVQMIINLQNSGEIELSNVQLIGTTAAHTTPTVFPATPLYQQTTLQQQLNGLFSYYYNSITAQPRDSLLTGWNFPLNPWQFNTTTLTSLGANAYTADQTIVIQQHIGTAANNISVGKASAANNYGLQIQAVATHNQFALLQWIDVSTVTECWNNYLSSMVQAAITYGTSTINPIQIKMRLLYTTAIPSTTSATYPVLSWTEGGDPVFSGVGSAVTAIAPPGDPAFNLTTSLQQFSFNSIPLPALTNATTYLGIFVYTVGLMNVPTTPDFIVFKDISLVPNQFAYPSNNKTFDETLRECQFYFEKSYENSILPGTSGNSIDAAYLSRLTNAQTVLFDTNWKLYPQTFSFTFNTVKRAIPTNMILYSPFSGASNTTDVSITESGTVAAGGTALAIANWSQTYLGSKGVEYISATSNVLATGSTTSSNIGAGFVDFHYTADSRIGV